MTTRQEIIDTPDEDLRNGNIAAAYLVFMDFKDTPRRWWTGWGDLTTDGHTYQGTGDVITIPRLPASMDASAETAAFQIQAATQEMQALVRAAKDRVVGRKVQVMLQFFTVEPTDEIVQPWSPLMTPITIYTGKMEQPEMQSGFKGEHFQGVITVNSHGLFSKRNSAANGRWTDADQKRRYPGDGGCSRMPLYAAGTRPIWTG